jgi:hypothetical protein
LSLRLDGQRGVQVMQEYWLVDIVNDHVEVCFADGAKSEQAAAVPGLANPRALLTGPWACSECGCRPLPAAEGGAPALIALRSRHAPRTAARFIADLESVSPNEHLIVNGQRFALRQGEGSIALSLPRAERETRALELSASPGACFSRFGVVPHAEDVPPPAPEE